MSQHATDMPNSDCVKLEVQECIAVITLNRPEFRNSLSHGMREALIETMRRVSQQDDVHVVILTGSGKAFCAGLDLKELQQARVPIQPDGMGVDSPVMKAFRDCPKPIIGAINGYAITGGFELALACDFLYAAESAQFADTHALVGLLPGWGLSQKLPRLIGINRAREISFSGRMVSAADAMAWGLVNRVWPDAELLEKTHEIAEQIAASDPTTLARIRSVMSTGWEMPLRQALQMESEEAGQFNSAVSLKQMNERLAQLKARNKR